MHKYWLIVLAVLNCLNLKGSEDLLVVTSFSIIEDMTINLSGGLLHVQNIVPAGQSPINYLLTDEDVELLSRANLLICNGLGLEPWLEDLIKNLDAQTKVVPLTSILLPEERNITDPHAWMNPLNGIKYIEQITKALSEIDPINTDKYEFNYQIYRQQLEDLDSYIYEQINHLPEHLPQIYFTQNALKHFGDRYGLRFIPLLNGSKTILELNKEAQDGAVVLFLKSTIDSNWNGEINQPFPNVISGVLYTETISETKDSAATYLDLLRFNAETIVEKINQSLELDQTIKGAESTLQLPYWLGSVVILVLGLSFFFLYMRSLFK